MELKSLTDLKNARLLVATINSINYSSKTANITFSETCEDLSGQSLAAVPFFYHCEHSSGTLMDLAEGFKAFRPLEVVYVLYVPENGDQIKQFYIVGHYNLRHTKTCTSDEYLVITLNIDSYKATTYTYVTIYDLKANAKLNLNDFVNLPGSPAKPASLPATSSSISAWLAYNFENLTSLTYMLSGGFTVSSQIWPAVLGNSWDEDIVESSDSTTYSGNSYALCQDFSVGNGVDISNSTLSYDGENDYGVNISYLEDLSREQTGATKHRVDASYCRAFFANYHSYRKEHLLNNRVWAGYLTYKGVTHRIWQESGYTYNRETVVTTTGNETTIESSAVTYTYEFTKTMRIDMPTICDKVIENNSSYSNIVQGSLTLPPAWNDTLRNVTKSYEYCSSAGLGMAPAYSSFIYGEPGDVMRVWIDTMSTTSKCFKTGETFVYGLIGALNVNMYHPGPPWNTCQYKEYNVFPLVFPSAMFCDPIVGSTGYMFEIIPNSSTTVTDISDLKEPSPPFQYVHVYDCIRNSDSSKSMVLDNVINELYDTIITATGPVTVLEVQEFLDEIKNGPTAVVKKRKII